MIPRNNAPREYDKIIDFSRELSNWPIRGIIMTHIARHRLVDLLEKLLDHGVLNSWEFTIRAFFIRNETCITFHPRTCNETIDSSLNTLLAILNSYPSKIIYKEGAFGYHITSAGNILKKWELDEGMC